MNPIFVSLTRSYKVTRVLIPKRSLTPIRYLRRNLNRPLETSILNVLLRDTSSELDRPVQPAFIPLNFNKSSCILTTTIIPISGCLSAVLRKILKTNLCRLTGLLS